MKDCLRRLGIAVDDSVEDVVRITRPRRRSSMTGAIELNTGQSAVSTRLLLAMAALRPGATLIDGHISMRNRPNKALVDALASLGAGMQSTNDGHLPTTVTGTRQLRGPVRVPSNISSQYLTSLLIIAPLLDAGLVIEVEGELTSKPYVDLTLDEMAKFGVRVDNQDYRRLSVAPQAIAPASIDVEGDASAASYFAALATLHGARIMLSNLGTNTRQGDYGFFGLCEKLGARVERTAASTVIEGPRELDAGFDGDGRHDQHAGRGAHVDDARAVPDRPDAHHRPRHAAREGMRPHRRAHARAAQARRDRGRGAGLHGHRAAAASTRDRSSADVKSWKSRPITIIASPCLSACSGRGCRACGFSIRAAWPRPIRITGRTGSAARDHAPLANRDRTNPKRSARSRAPAIESVPFARNEGCPHFC